MRFVVGVILTLLALWSGYWLVGERMIEGRIAGIVAQDLPPGVTLTQSGIDVIGFPNRFDLIVTNPALSDAATGWGWSAEFAQVFAMTWKPWHLIAALPHRQSLKTPAGAFTLASTRFMASVQVVPARDLALDEAVLEVEGAVLSGAQASDIGAAKLVVALQRDEAPKIKAAFAYRLGLQVEGLGPLLAGASEIQAARLDAVLSTSAALDRNAGQTRPDLTGIDLRALSLTRGAVVINGAGQISQGADGYAEGRVEFRIGGWRGLPQLLADLGLMKPEVAPTLARGLELVAKDQGNPEVLSLPLEYKSGRSYLAGLFIGRAPMMGQRQ